MVRLVASMASGAQTLLVLEGPAERRPRTAEMDALRDLGDRKDVAGFRRGRALEVAQDHHRALGAAERAERPLDAASRFLLEEDGLGRLLVLPLDSLQPGHVAGVLALVHPVPPLARSECGDRTGTGLPPTVATRLVQDDGCEPGAEPGAPLEGVDR